MNRPNSKNTDAPTVELETRQKTELFTKRLDEVRSDTPLQNLPINTLQTIFNDLLATTDESRIKKSSLYGWALGCHNESKGHDLDGFTFSNEIKNENSPYHMLSQEGFKEFTQDPEIHTRTREILGQVSLLNPNQDTSKEKKDDTPSLSPEKEKKAQECANKFLYLFLTLIEGSIHEEKLQEYEYHVAEQLIYKPGSNEELRDGVMLQSVQGDMAAGKTTTLKAIGQPSEAIIETGDISRATPGTQVESWKEVMKLVTYPRNAGLLLPSKFMRLVTMIEIEQRRKWLDDNGHEGLPITISGFPRTPEQSSLLQKIIAILQEHNQEIERRIKAVDMQIYKDHALERLVGRMIEAIKEGIEPRGDDITEIEFSPLNLDSNFRYPITKQPIEIIKDLFQKGGFFTNLNTKKQIAYLIEHGFQFKLKNIKDPNSTRYGSIHRSMLAVRKVLENNLGIPVVQISIDRSMSIDTVAQLLQSALEN
ncbi:hypothetical protein IT418_00795 [bacterium]|nr:hypothetical protein [bacterium]